jgi:hypothetical protein
MEADGWDQESAARKLVEALGKRKDLASVVSQYAYWSSKGKGVWSPLISLHLLSPDIISIPENGESVEVIVANCIQKRPVIANPVKAFHAASRNFLREMSKAANFESQSK